MRRSARSLISARMVGLSVDIGHYDGMSEKGNGRKEAARNKRGGLRGYDKTCISERETLPLSCLWPCKKRATVKPKGEALGLHARLKFIDSPSSLLDNCRTTERSRSLSEQRSCDRLRGSLWPGRSVPGT
jgi:hypothetical protein